MLTSQKIFYPSFHLPFKPYLSTILAIVMVIGMAGCEACNTKTAGDQVATNLQVTLTPSHLHGSKREAVLAITSLGQEKEVARFKDFEMKLEISAVGKNIGTSQVEFPMFDRFGKSNLRKIELNNKSKPMEVINGSLYEYFKGGENATLEYKQKEELIFRFLPDMASEIESITIKITVTNNTTHQEVFNGTTEWQRSPYKFEIIGLDAAGFIKDNQCTVQITMRDPKASITLGEVDNLEVEVKQDHALDTDPYFNEVKERAGKKVITFGSDELRDEKITKKLSINPGTGKELVTFSLFLRSADSENDGGIEAVAIAKHRPVIVPYNLVVTNSKLVGLSNKEFEIKIQDAEGQELQNEELAKLKLKVSRKQGSVAKINGDPGNGESFVVDLKDGNALTLSSDNKTATKKLIIDSGNDPQAAFECVLVDSEGNVVAGQQLSIEWGVGIVVIIEYSNENKQFKGKLTNQTGQKIENLKLAWKGLGETDAKVGGQVSGNKQINIEATKEHSEKLAVNWHTKNEAQFKFTVTTAEGAIIYQKEHAIAQNAPRLSISLVNPVGPFKVGNTVQLKIKADKKVDEAGLQIAKLQYTSSNHATLTINNQDVRGKNVQELLKLATNAEVKILNENEERTIDLTIDPQKDLSGGSFTDIHLESSYLKKGNKISIDNINWGGKVKVTMKPAESLKVQDDVLFADGYKGFDMLFTNESGFTLNEALLKDMVFTIVPEASKEPDKVLYQQLDFVKPNITLFDILKTRGEKDFKKDEVIKIPFTIVGTKNLIGFKMQLQVDGSTMEQQVRWGSLYADKVSIVDSGTKLVIKKTQGNNSIQLKFEVQNISGEQLNKADLDKITVQLRRINNKVGTIKLTDPKVNKDFSSPLLDENIKAKVSFFEGKVGLPDNVPVTLATLLQEINKVDSLNRQEKININLSMIPQPTEKSRNFLICLVDDQGIIISKREVQE